MPGCDNRATRLVLGIVVAVGRFAPRWFYPEQLESKCYIGRFWTKKESRRNGHPQHWSKTRRRVHESSINLATPAESRPEPPASTQGDVA